MKTGTARKAEILETCRSQLETTEHGKRIIGPERGFGHGDPSRLLYGTGIDLDKLFLQIAATIAQSEISEADAFRDRLCALADKLEDRIVLASKPDEVPGAAADVAAAIRQIASEL